jgi:Ala-tRNA(Pro) deacylase
MQCKERLETYLRENQVAYQVQHHPLAYTAQEVAESEHVPGKLLAKVVMAFADEAPLMLVLPADYRVQPETARAALGAETVRLAHEEEFADTFPDCEIGAMPPFGNLYGVPVVVDQALAEDETIVFQAGTHRDTMSTKYADFARLAKPRVARFAMHT